jgi:putative DNA methylase
MTTNPVKRRKKLIEVAIPLEAINAASAREKSIRHGHPSTLHLWWARQRSPLGLLLISSQQHRSKGRQSPPGRRPPTSDQIPAAQANDMFPRCTLAASHAHRQCRGDDADSDRFRDLSAGWWTSQTPVDSRLIPRADGPAAQLSIE